jgi:hypothetical protein
MRRSLAFVFAEPVTAWAHLTLQDEMPKGMYAGHQPIKPVASGTTPIQPHTPTTPVAASAIKATPAPMRAMRSMPPTFDFMVISFSG